LITMGTSKADTCSKRWLSFFTGRATFLVVLMLASFAYSEGDFTDNGDGSVTDGLSGFVWQQSDDGLQRTWGSAYAYCEELVLGGFDDWHLPSDQELQRLWEGGGVEIPVIDNSTFFCSPGYFWSRNTGAGEAPCDSNTAYYVSFLSRIVGCVSKDNYNYTRCIRYSAGSGPAYIFVDPVSYTFGQINIAYAFDSPGGNPAGITFDQEDLWVINSGSDRIYQIGITGEEIKSFDYTGNEPGSVTYDGEDLWILDDNDGKIYRVDTSGNDIGDFDAPIDNQIGLAFDRQTFWSIDPDSDSVFEFDRSGNVISEFESPVADPVGLAYDGEYFWSIDETIAKIYQFDFSGNIIQSFDYPGDAPTGLAIDGKYLWVTDKALDAVFKLSPDSKIFTITNSGDADLGVSFISVLEMDSDETSDEFLLDNENCLAQPVVPGDACQLEVRLELPALSSRNGAFGLTSARLMIGYNDGSPPGS